MLKIRESNEPNRFFLNMKSYGLAIAVHVVLFGVITFNLFFNPTKKATTDLNNDSPPMHAAIIDEKLLDKELEKIKHDDSEKQREEQQKLVEKKKKLDELRQKALVKQQELEKLYKLEEQKKRQIKQQKIEQKKLAEQKRIAEKKELEKKREREKEREKEREQEKDLQQKAELKLKQLEAEKIKSQEAEIKRKLEEEKKRKLALKRKKEAQEKQKRQDELQKRLTQETVARQAGQYLSLHSGRIKQKVTNQWNKPLKFRRGSKAKVFVRISPQGDVLTARLKQGSGDLIFDRSVLNAVYKASPLPIPHDPKLYQYYREFVFTFDPKG